MERDAVIDGCSLVNGRIPIFVDGNSRRITDDRRNPCAVVAVKLFVVGTGGNFLVGRNWNAAWPAQRQKFIENFPGDVGIIVGQIREIELIRKRNDHVRIAAAAGHGQDAGGRDKAEAAWVVGRIAKWLQPGVVIWHTVVIVVEALIDIAQAVQNTVGGNRIARIDRAGIGVKPDAAGVAIGLDFVGHGRNFVAHGHGVGLVGNVG